MRGKRLLPVVTTALATLLLAGCNQAGGPSMATSSDPTSASTTADGSAQPVVSKVLVLVVENHSLDQMRADMPWTYALAEKYGYATHFQAITHPSLPNYLAMAGGSTFDVTDDNVPAVNVVTGRSVFGEALASGHTATVYAEGMPRHCSTVDGGRRYAVRHNPWAYFADEQQDCRAHDVPMSHLRGDTEAGNLPDVGMVIPDVCNDAHDCPLGTTDAWMRRVVGMLTSGPDFTAGRLALVITADEDDYSQGNTVLTVVVHPSLHHVVVDTPLNHYSVEGLLSDVIGQRRLRNARFAPSLAGAFGLPL